jgi:streptogramin lyase
VTPPLVYRVDPATNGVVAVPTPPDGNACGPLAADDTSVWVSSGCNDPVLWRIDPASNTSTATVMLPGAADQVALGLGSVWATTTDSGGGKALLVRVDPGTNLIVGTTDTPAKGIQLGRALAVGEGAVWVGAGTALYKLAPA